jgi:RHS repeat-associated protein
VASWGTNSTAVATFGKPQPFEANLSGASLTASYPLDVAGGPKGMAPPLTLSYNSAGVNDQHNPQGAAGWVGEGWNLSMGAISWAEHLVADAGGTAWQDSWQLSDPYGTGVDLIPPTTSTAIYQEDSGHTIATGAVQWQTNPEIYAKIYSYQSALTITGNPTPPCWRVFLTNGVMEEFGCTADSLEYYPNSAGKAYIYSWLLDLIAEPDGNQIHVTYNRDMQTLNGLSYPRDAVMNTVEWDSPSCSNTSTLCTTTGTAPNLWAPLMRVSFSSSHAVLRSPTGSTNCGAATGTLRCDDPADKTGSGGLGIPNVQSDFVLNDIYTQVCDTGCSGATPPWNTLKDYQLGYDQSGPGSIANDPVSGKLESTAGKLNLTQVTVYGDDGSTALPVTNYTYTKVVEYYEDSLFFPASSTVGLCSFSACQNGTGSTNCGPSFNTGYTPYQRGCVLWSQSYDGNSYYLSSASNGIGLAQSFTWVNLRSNLHGTDWWNGHNGGYWNLASNPLWCNTNQSNIYPCDMADDGVWSRIGLASRTDSLVRLTQSGQGGAQTPTTVSGITSYTYQDVFPNAVQLCALHTSNGYPSACVAGFSWGSGYDNDFQDFYNGIFMGFTQVQVTNPDGGVEAHKFYSAEGWGGWGPNNAQGGTVGLSITCPYSAQSSPPSVDTCWSDPYWDVAPQGSYPGQANALHGREYEVDRYDTNGATLLEQTKTQYNPVCTPPIIPAGSPSVGGYTNNGWGGNLVSSLDLGNPEVPCDVQTTQVDHYQYNGATGTVPDQTTTYAYETGARTCATCYGRETKATTTSNDGNINGNPVSIVNTTAYTWNDAVTTSSTSASGHYLIDFVGFADTEDASANQKQCTYTSYDGQANTLGPLASLIKGDVSRSSTYTNCASLTTANELATTNFYDSLGNPVAKRDANMSSYGGSSPNSGCTTPSQGGSTYFTNCATFDAYFNALTIRTANALGQAATVAFQAPASANATGGFGLWPISSTDANNQITSHTYDALGRQTSVTMPLETGGLATQSMAYTVWCSGAAAQSPCAEVDKTQRLNSSQTVTARSFYDGAGNLVETRSPGPTGQDVVQFSFYDPSQQQVFKSVAYLVTTYTGGPGAGAYSIPDSTVAGTTYSHDGLGRTKSVKDPVSSTTNVSYSVACNATGTGDSECYSQVLTDDPLNHQSGEMTDAIGRIQYEQKYTGSSTATYAVYATTKYTYDYNGNQTMVLEPDGANTVTNQYDMASRMTSSFDVDLRSQTYVYDKNRNLTEMIDGRQSAAGTTFIGYDLLNRPIWRNTTNTPSGAYDTFTYDSQAGGNFGVGRLTSETFSAAPANPLSGSESYGYDARGRQTSSTMVVGANSYPLQTAYDDAGNVLNQTYPTGEVVTNTLTAQDWLSGVSTSMGSTTLLSGAAYAGTGGANGVITSAGLAGGVYQYSASFDLLARAYDLSLKKGTTTLFDQSRTFDAAGNVSTANTTLPAGTDNQAFCYDEQNRVVAAASSGTVPCQSLSAGTLSAANYNQSFAYDFMGRLTNGPLGAYSYGGQIQPHGAYAIGTSYTAGYDGAGNMTCRSVTSATTCSGTQTGAQLAYNNQGQLSNWQDKPGTPNMTGAFLYDGQGQRVAEQTVSGGVTTTVVYVGNIEQATYVVGGTSNIIPLSVKSGAPASSTTNVLNSVGSSIHMGGCNSTFGAPTKVTAIAGNAKATVSWQAPAPITGCTVSQYVITSYPENKMMTTDGMTTNVTLGDLLNGTSYTFTVYAYDVAGMGATSSPSNAVTPTGTNTVPSAPQSPSATGSGNQQVNVNWLPPASRGGAAISYYTVTSNPGGLTAQTTSTTASVTGLTGGTSYTFTVTATNAAGTGPASTPSNAVMAAAFPGAPVNVVATAGNGEAILNWTAPPSNGSPIIGYTVTSSPGGLVGTSTGPTTTDVVGLTNGTTYTFTVTASNGIGNGPTSSASNAVTPSSANANPPSFIQKANASQYGASDSVTMASTVTTGNRLIVLVEANIGTGSPTTTTGVTDSAGNSYTELQHAAAADGTDYSVWTALITAGGGTKPTIMTTNSSTTATIDLAVLEYAGLSQATGAGAVDQMASATGAAAGSPAEVSSGPTAATTGSGELALGFYVDAYGYVDQNTGYYIDGPSPDANWNSRASDSPAGPEFLVEEQPVSLGATPNARVYPCPYATWIVGTIVFKSASTAPNPPTNVSATAGNAQATVAWTAPTGTITGYTVASSPGGLTASVSGSTTSATVNGLTNGTAYTFTVTATSSSGTSGPSSPSNSVTPAGPPGAPTSVGATAGNVQATVSWTAPASNGGATITSYKVTSSPGGFNATTPNGTTTTATVTGLTNGTAYTFTVTATNSAGTGPASTASSSVTPAAPPGAPTNVTATAGNGQASVSWTAPASNGGAAITSYKATSSPGGLTATVSGGSTTATVSGLTNGTAYTFTVTATNWSGTGPASAASNSVTPAAVPGSPTSVSATPGNGQASVTWAAPSSNGGSAINYYTVTASPGGMSAQTPNGTTTTATVIGLANGTAYTFTVTATNSVGTGLPSSPSSAVTPAGPPGAPTSVGATAGNALATVSWTAPASNGGATITSYKVTSSPGGFNATTLNGTTTTATVTGLTNGTAYTFTVTATNWAGTGPASTASSSVTPAAPPGAPTNVTATAGNGQASVSWTAPASNGGAAITSYTATSSPGGLTATVSGGSTTATVSGLTNGTAYTFTVTATNWSGAGPASAASNSVTPAGPPGVPTNVSATAGNGQATVTWTAPSSNGGSAINYYTVTASPGGMSAQTPTGTTTTATVTGLANGTAYSFTVTATNGAGTGAASAASNSVTPVGPPGAPINVSATAGNRQASVNWTAPQSNGGAVITGYTVTSSPGGFTAAVNGSTTTATVTQLTNGTSYTFTVTATNSAGTGPASVASNSVTPAAPPGAPTGVTATGGNTQAVVAWNAPSSNGGAPITSYTVTSTPGGLTATSSTLTATVTGLTNGTSYTFTVTATNWAGTGPPSAASNAVVPAGPPSAPTNASATAGTAQASVSWTASASNNGATITSYTVTSTPGGLLATVNGTTTTATVTGLANGTSYTFSVTATNSAGTSAASTASNTVTPAAPPGPPTNVSATGGMGQGTVTWTAPASNGGAAITSFTVKSSPGGLTASVNGSSTSASVAGLTNGTSYTFTVTASNWAGTGAASSASNAVTTGVTIRTYYYANGTRIATAVNGVFRYLASDGLGSADVTLDSSGNLIASTLYVPYGGARYAIGIAATDYGFTGQHADTVSGLDYYGARYYDPVAGQFITPDSALPGNGYDIWGLSRYAYVEGNPIIRTDPSGHLPTCPPDPTDPTCGGLNGSGGTSGSGASNGGAALPPAGSSTTKSTPIGSASINVLKSSSCTTTARGWCVPTSSGTPTVPDWVVSMIQAAMQQSLAEIVALYQKGGLKALLDALDRINTGFGVASTAWTVLFEYTDIHYGGLRWGASIASFTLQTYLSYGFTAALAAFGLAVGDVVGAIIGAVGGAIIGALFAYFSDQSIHQQALTAQVACDNEAASNRPSYCAG